MSNSSNLLLFNILQVTQEKQVKGEEVNRNEAIAIEEPLTVTSRS